MSESRLRIKFGEHEFEAEGSTESVERQLEIFKRLVIPGTALKAAMETTQESAKDQAPLSLEKIMNVQGRTVSLRAAAKVDGAEQIARRLISQAAPRVDQPSSG